jgi:hypothetical protein
VPASFGPERGDRVPDGSASPRRARYARPVIYVYRLDAARLLSAFAGIWRLGLKHGRALDADDIAKTVDWRH